MARDTFVDGCLAVGLFAAAQIVVSLTLDASAVFEGLAVLGGTSLCIIFRRWTVSNAEKQKTLKKQKTLEVRPDRPRAHIASSRKETAKDAATQRSSEKVKERSQDAAALTAGAAADAFQTLADAAPNALIAAIRRGRLWEVPRLLDQALERAATEHPDSWQKQQEQIETGLLTVLRTCSVAHQHQAALSAYDHVISKSKAFPAIEGVGSEVLWSVLLYNAEEAKEFHRCVDFYDRLCQMSKPCNHDFVNVVHALAHLRMQPRFDKLMAEVESLNMDFCAQTRTRALSACCSEGAFEMADAIMISSAFSDKLNEMNFNTIMKGYGRKGQFKKCRALLEQMQRHGLQPTQMTYGILLDAGVSAKEYANVRKVFRDFVDSGLNPNAVHYTTLLKAIVHDGTVREVDELLELMEATPNAQPDLITYQLAMRAHADKGNLVGTVRILKRVISLGMRPDVLMYESVLSSCMEGVDPMKVLEVFDDLIKCGMKPNCGAFSKLLRALCQSKSWSAALEFLQSMKQRFGSPPNAWLYAQLGLSCIRGNDLNMAVVVHAALLQAHGGRSCKDGPGCCASARVLSRCLAKGDLAAAQALAFEASLASNNPKKDSKIGGISTMSHSKRLDIFFKVNQIDDRCRRLLLQLEPGQADWVMDQEFVLKVDAAKGTASAKVVAFVRRSKAANIAWEFYPGREDLRKKRLVAFLELNQLSQSDKVVHALYNLPDDQLRKLMDEAFMIEPAKGSTAAETLLAELAEVKDLAPGDEVFGGMLAEYIALNRIDDRCAHAFRSLPRADAAWIMDQEFKIDVDPVRGTASAKVIGLINRVRSGELRY